MLKYFRFLVFLALLIALPSDVAWSAIAYRAGAAHNEVDPTTSATVTIPGSVAADDICFLGIEDHGANADELSATVADDDSGGNTWAEAKNQGDAGSDESV